MKRMFFQKPKSLSYWSSFEEHKLVEMSDQRPESRFGTKDGAWALHIGPHIDGAGRALLSSPQQAASSCPTEDAWDDRELIEVNTYSSFDLHLCLDTRTVDGLSMCALRPAFVCVYRCLTRPFDRTVGAAPGGHPMPDSTKCAAAAARRGRIENKSYISTREQM